MPGRAVESLSVSSSSPWIIFREEREEREGGSLEGVRAYIVSVTVGRTWRSWVMRRMPVGLVPPRMRRCIVDGEVREMGGVGYKD